ncbi:hypothetical protein BCR36DRAFT_404698 [Piromyces finnis]|uniref:Condensation domain-containing protein n=1 Tax=Piromyces finnis TaxID=1754191 RepID=A0A1Y1V8P1_9FUNG|nr:hypothetical protein BCR36DRAFT_404698 [Piromyces finnis]|eukprot:ORX49730.1 hypothetical protein BCR36DRAFT_404698 [Piromyces finnis]
MGNKNKIFKFESFDMLQRIFIDRKYSNSIMRFIIKLKGKIDIEQFKKTVQLTINLFPLISCKASENIFTSKWIFYEFPIEDFIFVIEGKKGKEDEIIMENFKKNIDYDNGPQIRFVIVQYEDHDSLLISINHMICDATDFKNLLYMFCDLYSYPENVTDYSSMGDRGMAQFYRSLSLKKNFNILFSKDKPKYENIHLELEGDPSRLFLEKRTLTQEDFDKLKVYSKEKQVTLNDLFFTALMRTFYKKFNRTVIILCDINMRKYLQNKQTKGFTNMLTTIDCDIGSELGDTFEETLNKVAQCLNREKENIFCIKGLYITEIIKKLFPYRLCKSIIDSVYSPYPLEITNLGTIDKSKIHFKNIEASSVLLTGSTKYAPNFEMSICSFDKILSFCVNLYGTPSDQKIVGEVLDNFVQELKSVI